MILYESFISQKQKKKKNILNLKVFQYFEMLNKGKYSEMNYCKWKKSILILLIPVTKTWLQRFEFLLVV